MPLLKRSGSFRFDDPFKKDRDYMYKHINFTKKITKNYQYFLIGLILVNIVLINLIKLIKYFKIRFVNSLINSLINYSSINKFKIYLSSTSKIKYFNNNLNLIIISSFYLINLFTSFYKLPLNSFNIALRFGLISISNLPLLYLIPLKSGPIYYLLNQSYENLIIYHKYIGFLVLIMSFLHGLFFIYCLSWDYLFGNIKGYTGLLSISPFILIFITLFIKKNWYEIFYFIHISSLLIFLPIFYNHHYVCKPFVLLILIIYLIDKLIKFNKNWLLNCLIYNEDDYLIIEIDPFINSYPLINLLLLKFLNQRFNFNLTNHLFITIPKINPFQSHPFTIASKPNDDKIILIVKINNGFTKKLYHQVKSSPLKLTCIINGPYGLSNQQLPQIYDNDINDRDIHDIRNNIDLENIPLLQHTKTKIILIAAGSGISLILPLFQYYKEFHQFDISLIWIIKNDSILKLPYINELTNYENSDSYRDINIWKTLLNGRPNINQFLSNCSINFKKIYIIGCGPNELMKQIRNFSTNQDKTIEINLILEEFSF